MALGTIRSPPTLTVSAWADRERRLSPEDSAEIGPWRTDRAPYGREIMDCLSPSNPIQKVVWMKAAQVGATQLLNNFVGFIIHQDPGPALIVQPTTDLGKAWSKDRLAPMVRDTPALRQLVPEARSRDSENTVQHKKFPGGHLTVVGANAPAGLASRPIRYVLLDEVDRYPVSAGSEGDPILLAVKRSTTFWNRKIFVISSPTVKGASRIEAEWENSDQRRFWVPCPECDTMQTLVWSQVVWSEIGREPADAAYRCAHCRAIIENYRKLWMLRRGEWRAANPGPNRAAGFHLSELYSPFRTWGETAVDFWAARHSPAKLRTWINTALGETWEEAGDSPEWEKLLLAREDYETGHVPTPALVVTGMCDVQKDRLEWAVYAWGEAGEGQLEGWLIDFGVIYGDTERSDAIWAELRTITQRQYSDPEGCSFKIDAFGVDSGYLTNRVYWFCRGQERIYATDGRAQKMHPFVGRATAQDIDYAGRTIRNGVLLWPLGTYSLKSWVYAELRALAAGDSPKLHFPRSCERDFFEQMTAEFLAVKEMKSGETETEWRLRAGRRNEQLDLIVGARAMAAQVGVDRMTRQQWALLRAERKQRPLSPPPGSPIPPPASPFAGRVFRSNYMLR